MKVMIVVTHLLGTGHLARALTLARSFEAAGDETCVVTGGMPAPLLRAGYTGQLIQLPPVRSDGVDFSKLLGPDATLATSEYLGIRQKSLLDAFAGFGPDVLITELFPFGRRILRDEFAALLTLAKARANPPLVYASIRDILAPPSKPKKVIYADAMIDAYYDAVLVHSDPDFTPLEISWPVSPMLRTKLRYTGFVAPKHAGPHPENAGHGEIIVSAGGGDVGGHVYDAALAAAAFMDHPMRLLIGGTAPQARIAALQRRAPAHVIIQAARPDFRQMLYQAAASVSLCGYNTALDILQAGTPAVFIPFDEGNEVEQRMRAVALAETSGIVSLKRSDLTVQTLCAALENVMTAPRRPANVAQFDGADQTVRIIRSHRLGA